MIKLSKITPSNVKGFITGWYNFLFRSEQEFLQHQFIFRLDMAQTSCLQNKMCPCFCELPEKLYDPRACDENCYPEFPSKESWEKIKDDPNYIANFEDTCDRVIHKLATNGIPFRVEDYKYKDKNRVRITLL